jgi:hypothetical protein
MPPISCRRSLSKTANLIEEEPAFKTKIKAVSLAFGMICFLSIKRLSAGGIWCMPNQPIGGNFITKAGDAPLEAFPLI